MPVKLLLAKTTTSHNTTSSTQSNTNMIVDKPIVDTPIVNTPIVNNPIVEKPIVEKPIAELQSNINASLTTKATITQAEQNSKKLETILVNGTFKVQSFVTAGVDSANNYKDTTVDFANDWKVKAVTALTTAATGTYAVSSELDVFLKLNFTGSTSFSLLNNTWKVASFTTSTITLQSKTNAAVTLVLTQI